MIFFQRILLLCGLCFGCVAIAHALPAGAIKSDIQGVKAYSSKVTLPDGSIARIRMYAGEMATITVTPDGRGIGFIAVPAPSKFGQIKVQIFNLSSATAQQENLLPASVIRIAEQDEMSFTHEGMNFKIEMQSFAPGEPTIPNETNTNNDLLGGGKCCVTCGSTTACGGSVGMDCGSCCTGDFCR